ncbi:hypothetical protein KEM55_000262, partial [Ascosphaera atra]
NVLPGDRVRLADWTPPSQSVIASGLGETEQLRVLRNYTSTVEDELHRHNGVRAPMEQCYSHRGPNYFKALDNWKRRNNYLIHEILRFKMYVDTLAYAQQARDAVYKEREEHKAAVGQADNSSKEA